MKTVNMPAVRALVQALNRDEHLKAQEEGARSDRLFDGGEWSDAWHAQTFQDITTAIAWRVAARFQMNGDELMNEMWAASCMESEQQQVAMNPLVGSDRVAVSRRTAEAFIKRGGPVGGDE